MPGFLQWKFLKLIFFWQTCFLWLSPEHSIRIGCNSTNWRITILPQPPIHWTKFVSVVQMLSLCWCLSPILTTYSLVIKPACLDVLVYWTKKRINKNQLKNQSWSCLDEPEDLHIDVSQSKVAYFPDLEIFHINQDQYKDKDRENDKDRWPCSVFHIDQKSPRHRHRQIKRQRQRQMTLQGFSSINWV